LASSHSFGGDAEEAPMPETSCVEAPAIRYTQSGDVSIAYAISGQGPPDIVFVHGYIGNLEVEWEDPGHVAFFTKLAAASRVIRFDRRGSGLSDRVRDVPTLETRMDDLRAVMDAAGSTRAVLVATFEAAAMAMLFAATYPERVAGLVLFYPLAKGMWAPDYPFAPTEDEYRHEFEEIRTGWGEPAQAERFIREAAPSAAGDPQFVAWATRMFRQGASPGAALALRRMVMNVDVRDILPSIRVPTLIVHTSARRDESEYIAERIPGARRLELKGRVRVFWLADGFPDAITDFARAVWSEPEPDTLLATVLFTDIVDSTAKAAELGDHSWRNLVERHHALVRAQLDRYRGRELDTAGDGFFATFDGPIRAIRCAVAARAAVRELGLEIRAGLHTGECELIGEKPGGIAVNIGARVAAKAQPGEVLVSQTVKDLVAGSGITFEDRGVAQLKGIPGDWRLYAVDAAV
jgi:class 3 adenylate cyclase/alpha-beta hydrolase superfamily lysophospholipase